MGELPLKIAIDAVGLRNRGGATVLVSTLDGLCRARPDWRFTVHASPPDRQQIDFPAHANLTTTFVRERGVLDRLRWLTGGLGAAARRDGADAVLSMANLPPLRCSLPIILYVHQMKLLDDAQPLTPRVRLLRAYFRVSASRARAVVVQTRAMAEKLAQRFASLAGRVVTIPSAVDIAELGADAAALGERLAGLPSPRLCYVSSASAHKNHARLFDAFAASRTATQGGTLIVTIDRAEADAIAASCGAAARAAIESGRIAALGSIPPRTVRAVYEGCDLMVFPSLLESFGLPLAEAMTLGCPVVAADHPYARELLSEAGVYFDPQDVDAIAAAIDGIATDRTRLAAMAEAGLAGSDRFRPEVYGDRMAEVIERAVRGEA